MASFSLIAIAHGAHLAQFLLQVVVIAEPEEYIIVGRDRAVVCVLAYPHQDAAHTQIGRRIVLPVINYALAVAKKV